MTKLNLAIWYLNLMLFDGPVSAEEIVTTGNKLGFSKSILTCALKALIKTKSASRLKTPRVLEASNWLETYLSSGPKAATETYAAALEQGYSGRTLERAKSRLHVYSRLGYHLAEHRNRWMWYPPNQNPHKEKPCKHSLKKS